MSNFTLSTDKWNVHDITTLGRWKKHVRCILLTLDAWKVVDCTCKPPPDGAHPLDQSQWKSLCNTALGWMLLTLREADFPAHTYEDPRKLLEDMFNWYKDVENRPLKVNAKYAVKPSPYAKMTYEEFMAHTRF